MKKSISPIRTILKVLLAIFLLFTILQLAALMFETIVETVTSDEEQRRQERLLEYAAEDRYGDLYDELTLYELYDEEYTCYWQVSEAYHLYCQYQAAVFASQQGEDAAFAKKCEERAAELLKELEDFPADTGNPTVDAAILRIQSKISSDSAGSPPQPAP